MTFRPLHDRVVVRLVEDEEKKDRVPDAMHATKAAAEDGVCPAAPPCSTPRPRWPTVRPTTRT
jgi:hypothetical protein